MLDKNIKAEFKIAFESSTGIYEMDACCWKIWRPDKKEEIFKSHKEKKAKPADKSAYYLGRKKYLALQPESLENQKKLLQLIIKLYSRWYPCHWFKLG